MVTVITKTIGPSGRDYTTFALAEAATSTIGTSADLVANDEAIVFQADPTTFTASASIYLSNPSLVTDATRNVTYTAASGRPVYTYTGTGTGVGIYDPYTRWSGIDVLGASAGKAMQVRANTGYGADQAGTVIENATITSATTAVDCGKFDTGLALGTSTEPITLRNLVTKSRVAVSQFISGTGHTKGAHCLVVNCTHLGGSSPNQVWNWALTGGMPDASFKIINCANLASDTSNDANITGGGCDVSGSTNNIGNAAASSSSFRFENIGGGIGSQYTPTTSFSTPLGAGDYSVFMGSNGSLANVTGNDVWQQGVGPGSNASVPTTDINGVARSGASCNPGAFEADGFVAPTVTTQTIGPTGRDFATFTLAEASLPAEDITFTNRAFEFLADAATYSESVTFQSSLTTDATRQVTYKPAAGSEHGGDKDSGVRLSGTGFTLNCQATEKFLRFEGIVIRSSLAFGYVTVLRPEGLKLSRCIVEATGSSSRPLFIANAATSGNPVVVENSVMISADYQACYFFCSTADTYGKVVNCTLRVLGGSQPAIQGIETGGFSVYPEVINCLVLNEGTGGAWSYSGSNASGSNNFGGSTNPFPVALQGSPYPITATTSFSTPLGAGDFAVYMGSNGSLANVTGNDVWQQGVGPGTNSDVPTTDINGVARSGATANPGAFEADGFVAPTVTTQTIGPTGRDFATFTLAEASLPAEDITFTNRAFVFEADAATYNETLFTSSALVSDATRNVTYRAASGEEHGGDPNSGPIIQDATTGTAVLLLYDDFTAFDGLVIKKVSPGTNRTIRSMTSATDGIVFRNLIVENTGTSTQRAFEIQGAGIRYENLVVATVGDAFRYLSGTGQSHTYVNCTVKSGTWGYYATSGGGTVTITNALNLDVTRDYSYSGGWTVTGTNNYGSATSFQFPVAVQGSPYPVTASTAYDPGAGDFALYVSSTGQLLDSPNNDVIGGGVGPAANADVPTTDIVGRVRTGGTTNPGAFAVAQATRVIGKTIGPVGRDYASFTLAESAVESIATAETGSTDLVAGNARIEFLADAGTYDEQLVAISTLTTDATRNVTYKPASGSEHNGAANAGVILYRNAAGQNGTDVRDDYTELRGLNLYQGLATTGRSPLLVFADGCVIDGCILTSLGSGAIGVQLHGASSAASFTVQNSVLDVSYIGLLAYSGNAHSVTALNVTTSAAITSRAFAFNDTQTGEFVNCLVLGPQAITTVGTVTLSGSNNFGPSGNPFPVAIQGSPYPITATTNTDPGPGHFAIYDADTGALVNVAANTVWQRGVGPSVNSDVPTTGILGFPRSGATANPGAFAASTSLAATTNPVARFFTYKRPSTQVFNHHRRISCVFPDDGPSGNSNTFAVGVAARGNISPVTRDCVAFFVFYTTDGSGAQTSLRLEVARIFGAYSDDAIVNAQPIAVIEKQAVGEAIPAGFDFPGQSHTVAFKAQTFSGATTPESAAEYTAFIDGTAVAFTTFYQSATQDGTTKVVTHPAPAVGTTQGRAESFFWYATADRLDSSGSENYSLPQWSGWTQLAVDPDPLFDGDGETVAVLGEGTGTVNLSTAVEHVDWNISIQYELPRFDVTFASGHRYTSPRFENARRLITASATNVDKATMDLIVQFHEARKGIEDPFLFNFPIPATMASETYTVITVQFADQNGMVYRREAEDTYSVQLNLIELL